MNELYRVPGEAAHLPAYDLANAKAANPRKQPTPFTSIASNVDCAARGHCDGMSRSSKDALQLGHFAMHDPWRPVARSSRLWTEMTERGHWQMRLFARYFVVAAFVLLVCGPPGGVASGADDLTGTLTVHARGLASDDGNLRFVLFDSKKNFLKRPVRAEVVKIDGQQGTWTIEGLPYGTYAVLVHHDIDASGAMERHWYGKPKEPTGASNDAPAKFGPPKFKDEKFQLESTILTLTVTVR